MLHYYLSNIKSKETSFSMVSVEFDLELIYYKYDFIIIMKWSERF